MFDTWFKPNTEAHLKRAALMLREANLARIEHQAAAEHHGALAQMYAERVTRLEQEVYGERAVAWRDDSPRVATPDASEKVRHYPFGDRRLEHG